MADEKLNTGPAENTSPEAAGPITTPEQAAASEPRQEHTGPTIPESGDVVGGSRFRRSACQDKRTGLRKYPTG